MGARREVVSAVMERYRSAKRAEKGRILDELCARSDWHRKHTVRAAATRDGWSGRGRGNTKAKTQIWHDDQGCADGAVGGVG
jgi:hypothetical protein